MYIVLMVSGSLLFMFIRLILFKQVPYELTAYANKEIEFWFLIEFAIQSLPNVNSF